MRRSTLFTTLGTCAVSLSLTCPALAQDDEDSSASAEASGSASYSTSDGPRSSGSATSTGAAPGGTDHSRFVGTFGIGYLGYRTMGVGVAGGGETTVEAPVVGVRYWLNSGMGVDAGLGIATGGSSTTTETGGMDMDVDAPDPLAVIIHGGLPFALKSSEHFVFEVVPEFNFGWAVNTVEAPGGDVDEGGVHFDLGARAGAEIHFGFIDIPELALQAGLGLRFAWERVSWDDGNGNSQKTSRTRLATAVGDNPWNILTANVAALYYF